MSPRYLDLADWGDVGEFVRSARDAAVAEMSQPVECRCGGVYDLGTVVVTGCYLDCSLWKAPCCGVLSDSRNEEGSGWSSRVDYRRIAGGRLGFDGEDGLLDYLTRPEASRR